MSDTIVLNGVEVELSSDAGRAFISDACRAAESVVSDSHLLEKYELSIEALQKLANRKEIGRLILREREHRLRSGLATRELAAKNLVKGQGILDRIMSDEQTNARYRIAAITETRQTAIPENPNSPLQSDSRFIIQINLGEESVTYNKSIAIDPNDSPPDAKSTTTARPKLVVLNDGISDNE